MEKGNKKDLHLLLVLLWRCKWGLLFLLDPNKPFFPLPKLLEDLRRIIKSRNNEKNLEPICIYYIKLWAQSDQLTAFPRCCWQCRCRCLRPPSGLSRCARRAPWGAWNPRYHHQKSQTLRSEKQKKSVYNKIHGLLPFRGKKGREKTLHSKLQ